jgi:hypothetical protein
MGPEAMLKYINPEEVVKRMAAAQGIDVLNLVKTMQEVQASTQQTMEQQKQMELTKQVGQIAQAPLMDPTKNPEAEKAFNEQNQTNTPQPGR